MGQRLKTKKGFLTDIIMDHSIEILILNLNLDRIIIC